MGPMVVHDDIATTTTLLCAEHGRPSTLCVLCWDEGRRHVAFMICPHRNHRHHCAFCRDAAAAAVVAEKLSHEEDTPKKKNSAEIRTSVKRKTPPPQPQSTSTATTTTLCEHGNRARRCPKCVEGVLCPHDWPINECSSCNSVKRAKKDDAPIPTTSHPQRSPPPSDEKLPENPQEARPKEPEGAPKVQLTGTKKFKAPKIGAFFVSFDYSKLQSKEKNKKAPKVQSTETKKAAKVLSKQTKKAAKVESKEPKKAPKDDSKETKKTRKTRMVPPESDDESDGAKTVVFTLCVHGKAECDDCSHECDDVKKNLCIICKKNGVGGAGLCDEHHKPKLDCDPCKIKLKSLVKPARCVKCHERHSENQCRSTIRISKGLMLPAAADSPYQDDDLMEIEEPPTDKIPAATIPSNGLCEHGNRSRRCLKCVEGILCPHGWPANECASCNKPTKNIMPVVKQVTPQTVCDSSAMMSNTAAAPQPSGESQPTAPPTKIPKAPAATQPQVPDSGKNFVFRPMKNVTRKSVPLPSGLPTPYEPVRRDVDPVAPITLQPSSSSRPSGPDLSKTSSSRPAGPDLSKNSSSRPAGPDLSKTSSSRPAGPDLSKTYETAAVRSVPFSCTRLWDNLVVIHASTTAADDDPIKVTWRVNAETLEVLDEPGLPPVDEVVRVHRMHITRFLATLTNNFKYEIQADAFKNFVVSVNE